MKARVKATGEIVDVFALPLGGYQQRQKDIVQARVFQASDLDFGVPDGEDSDLSISVAKLREVLMDMANLRGIIREMPVDVIIDKVKSEI